MGEKIKIEIITRQPHMPLKGEVWAILAHPLLQQTTKPKKNNLWSAAYGIRNLCPAGPKFCKYWALTGVALEKEFRSGSHIRGGACPNDLYSMPRKPPIGKGTVIETPRNKM